MSHNGHAGSTSEPDKSNETGFDSSHDSRAGAPLEWPEVYRCSVDQIREAFRSLRSLPWSTFSSKQQLEALGDIAPLRSELEALIAHGLTEIDRSGAAHTEHGQTARRWLSQHTGESRASASRTRALGRILEQFPLFAQALDDGAISVDHAHVLANAMNPRVRVILQESEQELVDLASKSTVEQWRRDLRALIDLADQDGPEPEKPKRQDEATVIYDETGRLIVRGEFFGTSAVTLFDLITSETTRQFRAARKEHKHAGNEIPAPKFIRGRALIELLRRGGVHGKSKKGKTEAVIVLDPSSQLHPIRTLDGDDIDPVTAAIMLCDAYLNPLHVDANGHPLSYGRTLRFVSDAQQRALAIRDGGCVFPGCDVPPSWCDAHHIVTWTKGNGPTDINNLVLLCRSHHGLVHSHEWTLEHVGCVGYEVPHSHHGFNSHDCGGTHASTAPPVLTHNVSNRTLDIVNATTRHQRQPNRSETRNCDPP